MPKLDTLSVLRCVQVVRRLLLKNRDVGLFCNLSAAALTDWRLSAVPRIHRRQSRHCASTGVRIHPERGPRHGADRARRAGGARRTRLSLLDGQSHDLRLEPRELNERGFRFVKAPAALLFNRVGAVSTDIHPADLSDLLGRFGIDLVADHIEAENTVVDLLDYDVRFGQGFLFSPPRPVRAEALAGACRCGERRGHGAWRRGLRRPAVAAAGDWPAPASAGCSGLSHSSRAKLPRINRGRKTERTIVPNSGMPRFIERFEPLARDYDVLLCDVWGVVHNGIAAFAPACAALTALPRRRRRVSSSPMRRDRVDAVERILDRLAVAASAYDTITASGDVTRGIVERSAWPDLFHLGPQRDCSIFDGLDVAFAPLERRRLRGLLGPVRRHHRNAGELPRYARRDAGAFAVHGLRQPRYRRRAWRRPRLLRRRARRRLCGGGRRGAVLRQAARADLRGCARHGDRGVRGGRVPLSDRVLAIGNSVRTDLKGAAAFGLDCMFVTSGIHAGA